MQIIVVIMYALFLSTLSLRRATYCCSCTAHSRQFLSTLSLRRATGRITSNGTKKLNFYPRSPCGERLDSILAGVNELLISIHALLAESDLAGPSGPAFLYNFYPRSPCGERRYWFGVPVVGRAISIHALLAESDSMGLDGRFKL